MSAVDEDELFALARDLRGGDRVVPTLSIDAVCDAVRTSVFAGRTRRRATGGCTNACSESVVAYELRAFRNDDDARVHVCVEGSCRAVPHPTTRVDIARVVVAWRGAAVMYACTRHARMHACVEDVCHVTTTLADGFVACAFSGRVVSAPLAAAYSSATSVIDSSLAAVRDEAVAERRRAVVDARPAAVALVAMLDAPRGADGDVDFPTRALFPRSGAANTFGDDEDLTLASRYSAAHAVTHTLLVSEARAAIVAARRALVFRTAVVDTVRPYVRRRRAARKIVYRHTLRALVARVEAKRRVYPTLVVPPHGDERLVAYFSALCVEMYTNLVHVARSSALKATPKDRKKIAPLFTTPVKTVVPSLLQRFERGVEFPSGVVVAYREPWLALMPDEPTMLALGCTSRTPVEKFLRPLLGCVAASPRALAESLRATQLDIVDVIGAPDGASVVRLFLQRRRARLQQ